MTRLPEPTDLREPHQRDLSEREWRLGDFPISFWDEADIWGEPVKTKENAACTSMTEATCNPTDR